MREELHEELVNATEVLRHRLARCATRDVVATLANYHLARNNSGDDFVGDLSSPAKQGAFLLSLLLTTDAPANPRKFDANEWSACVALLEQIIRTYALAYWPTADDEVSPKWLKAREVAMPAFLHFFNNGLPASTDQVAERIRAYLVPHDSKIQEIFGLSASTALSICRHVHSTAQDNLDRVVSLGGRENDLRNQLLDEAEAEKLSTSEVRARGAALGYPDVAATYFAEFDSFGLLQVDELVAQFGDPGRLFWELFSRPRRKTDETVYFAGALTVERCPMVRIDDSKAVFVLTHSLFTATLLAMEEALLSGEYSEKYLKARDKILESQTETVFRRILPSASQYPRVFETPELQYEHDLVIIHGDTCLLVEAKAAPPVEPFRDPDKAYNRIRRLFRSDRGIQKAYDQALRIWRRWKKGESVPLYDSKRQIAYTISPEQVRRCVLVCVTRDDFGPIATDLSLLLEKKDSEPFAWAPNILSLEFLADGWPELQLNEQDFIRFLLARVQLHGRVFSADELEVAGYFVRHGSLSRLLSGSWDRVALDTRYSDVFDQVYLSKFGHPPVKLELCDPIETDMRELLQRQDGLVEAAPKQPRNALCLCGSGRKFKKCCGRYR